MRPAWLPVDSAVSIHSPRTGRPRSAAARPPPQQSNSPPRDAMVLSARQLLHEPAAQVSSAADPVVSLREFMDSFPLVPLAIIPRLLLADLIECEAGLVTLYKSLAVDTNADDAQLAKYITRQLGLVQRHMEQARARERVLKLLTGEEPTAVTTTSSSSSSSRPLPVFLQPVSLVQPGYGTPPAAVLTTTKSASSLTVKASQLSKARAVAKATLTTAFVITTRETSLKTRQKNAKAKTTQQLEEEKAKQQERDKEKRRQAAYQRLLARQALQAKKKQDAQAKKKATAPPSESSSFLSVTEQGCTVPNAEDTVVSSSSSDESDVSNCSENDEADEKAILDMPVVGVAHSASDEEREVQGGENGDLSAEDEELAGDNEVEEEEEEEEEETVENNDGGGERIENEPREVTTREEEDARRSDEPQVDEEDENQVKVTEGEPGVSSPAARKYDATVIETPEVEEQRVREEIARQLERFVTERTQSALDHLRSRQKDVMVSSARSESPARPSTSRSQQSSSSSSSQYDFTPTASAASTLPPSPTKQKRPQAGKRQRPTASTSNLLVIPRPIGRELQDYRSYFANFFCILTSVYEQRLALTAGTATNSSSIASTNISATVAHAGDQALRLQLKLYQSWETIMHDYATVFGNASSTNMTATSSPYTAHYRINSQTRKEVSDIVVTALEKLGDWDEHPSGLGLKTTWNLLWTWSKPNVERKTLLAWQKVNHFQHAKAITRKDCLKKSIAKYHAMGGRLKQAYDIVPMSFLLPQEYVAFVQAFQARGRLVPTGKNIWIMKPVALSRGRGISLVNDLSDVVYSEQVVIQEYIANPLLLDGFKFDLRLYVLVTSFNPLEAFFYEEGFVRMCTHAYEDGDLSNLFIHLTNSSIQKENQDAVTGNPENPINAAQAGTEAGGTKMTLAYLWKRLEIIGADVATVKSDILSVILKALLCGEDHIPFQVNSFDLYGYDILLDTNFRPWLIEVNSSPSMARENELDYQVKDALIYDTLRLVKPLHFDRCKLSEVLARRFHDAEMEKKRSHANTRHPKEAEAIATRQLNEDLTEILRGQVPRAFGELPDHMGSYTRIAPYTTLHNQLMKLKKSCLRLDRK